jgi:hypothetical protein
MDERCAPDYLAGVAAAFFPAGSALAAGTAPVTFLTSSAGPIFALNTSKRPLPFFSALPRTSMPGFNSSSVAVELLVFVSFDCGVTEKMRTFFSLFSVENVRVALSTEKILPEKGRGRSDGVESGSAAVGDGDAFGVPAVAGRLPAINSEASARMKSREFIKLCVLLNNTGLFVMKRFAGVKIYLLQCG